jgi:hypothetical protein
MDTAVGRRENRTVLHPGASRRRIARTLNAAYAGGLLSDDTFARRIEQVLKARLIDPRALVGDLNLRRSGRREGGLRAGIRNALTLFAAGATTETAGPVLLALDWTGSQSELLVGRHHSCDVVLENLSVSRRHARLLFRDAKWIVQDLASTNGTIVNGTRIGRCELRPGDHLVLGNAYLTID